MQTIIALIGLVLIGFVFWAWKEKRKTILEGIIIGVIVGFFTSFLTDANYRADVLGPIINWARKCSVNWKYTSRNWTEIEYKKVNDNKFNVQAKNVVTGNTVNFGNTSLNNLPPDLKYDILTWSEPDKAVGGSTVKLRN